MTALTRHQNSLYRRKNINTIYQRKNTRSIYGGGWWDNVKKFGQKIWDNRDNIIEIGKKIGESGIIGNVKDLFNKVKTGDYKGAVDIAKVGAEKGSKILNDNQDTLRNILGIGRKRGGAIVMPGGAMRMPGGAIRMPGGAIRMPGGARTVYGPYKNEDAVARKAYMSVPVSLRKKVNQPNPGLPFDSAVISKEMPEDTPVVTVKPRKYVKKMSKQYIKKITGKGITRL
jgi:hypothetical protein